MFFLNDEDFLPLNLTIAPSNKTVNSPYHQVSSVLAVWKLLYYPFHEHSVQPKAVPRHYYRSLLHGLL